MADNPFDEFDTAPTANPFDEFDVKPSYREDAHKLAADPAGVAWSDIKRIPDDFVSGVKSLGSRVVHDVTNPQDAVSDTVGLVRKLNPLTNVYDAVKDAIKDPEASARQVADPARPVSSVLNALTMLFGGEGTLGRAALRGTTGAARGADVVGRGATELLSGVSTDYQRAASRAGELGGAEGSTFRANMRDPDWAGIQDMGQQGVRDAAGARSAQYGADMAGLPQNALTYRPVINALQQARDMYTGPGGQFIKDTPARDALHEVAQKVHTWLSEPTEVGDALSMDALKQSVGDIRQRQPQGSRARRVVDHVYNAIGDHIRATAPEYDAAMGHFSGASEDISNMVKSLSLGESASRFTTGGKLMSAMGSGGSVARGARAQSLAQVAAHQPLLPYALAGAAMHPPLPRGIVARGSAIMRGAGGAGVGGVAALVNPGFLAALAAASPRVVGNARYAVGATVRGARRAGATQKNLGILSDAARIDGENNKQ